MVYSNAIQCPRLLTLSSRPDLASSLKVGRGGPATHRSRLRSTLLVFQAGLSVILLIGAGLFVKSLGLIRGMDSGMDLGLLVVASVDLKGAGYDSTESLRLQNEAMDRIRRIPGVAGVSGTNSIPFWSSWSEDLRAEGTDTLPDFPGGGPYINAVSSDYFTVAGTPTMVSLEPLAASMRSASAAPHTTATLPPPMPATSASARPPMDSVSNCPLR